jgi:GR25 family glycosyltransferase involved in LPS biosynthesis
MDKEVLNNACFEVFHTDTGNLLRNQSYDGIIEGVSFLPRLGSPTMYLNTVDKVENFVNLHPEFKVNTVEDYCQPGETFPPSAGVVGVWASNYLAWKKFLDSDYDAMIIFEDDILVSKNFKSIVESYMTELPFDWDFFSFFVPDDSLFAFNEDQHGIGAENVCISYQQWSCAGYMVSKAGARKAIEDVESRGINCPVDWYIFNFRMKKEENQKTFFTYTLKPGKYRPIRFLSQAAKHSQIHHGSTELIN